MFKVDFTNVQVHPKNFTPFASFSPVSSTPSDILRQGLHFRQNFAKTKMLLRHHIKSGVDWKSQAWQLPCEIVIFYLVHAPPKKHLMFAIIVQQANKTDHLFYV